MIKQLNALASEMVGDGKSPNLFFVTVSGNVVLTATDFAQAYGYWKSLARGYPKRVETMLEDRKVGIIASAGMEKQYEEKTDDFTGPEQWEVHDDSYTFGLRKKYE
jgi:hypothetical protein